MIPPLIGITTYGRDEEQCFTLPAVYVDAVRRAGGVPVLLPPGEQHWQALLSRLDGLILAGGGDLDPCHYAGVPHETIYNVDAERDRSELALVRQVVSESMPTLGICRGAQVVNVALGGTLIEHVPEVVRECIAQVAQVAHRLPPRRPTEHPITVESESRLGEILGDVLGDVLGDAAGQVFCAASWHHQAIRAPAPQLRVVARAPDGIIEAVEMPGHPWLIAVQWHPELTAAGDPVQQRLFDSLVQAAARRRDDRS